MDQRIFTEGMESVKNYELLPVQVNPKIPKVLITDDSFKSVLPLEQAFKNYGCTTRFSYNCKTAVDMITRSHYDLIVLDWLLPDGTGRNVLQLSQGKISENESLSDMFPVGKKIPVVISSAYPVGILGIEKFTNFEIVDFWPKQMSFRNLRKEVVRLVQNL